MQVALVNVPRRVLGRVRLELRGRDARSGQWAALETERIAPEGVDLALLLEQSANALLTLCSEFELTAEVLGLGPRSVSVPAAALARGPGFTHRQDAETDGLGFLAWSGARVSEVAPHLELLEVEQPGTPRRWRVEWRGLERSGRVELGERRPVEPLSR